MHKHGKHLRGENPKMGSAPLRNTCNCCLLASCGGAKGPRLVCMHGVVRCSRVNLEGPGPEKTGLNPVGPIGRLSLSLAVLATPRQTRLTVGLFISPYNMDTRLLQAGRATGPALAQGQAQPLVASAPRATSRRAAVKATKVDGCTAYNSALGNCFDLELADAMIGRSGAGVIAKVRALPPHCGASPPTQMGEKSPVRACVRAKP